MGKKSGAILVIFLILTWMQPYVFSSTEEPFQIPKFSHPPKIDGILENPFWEQEAMKIENFLQLTPKEKGTPSEKTIAYVGYDKKNLYLAFRCFEKNPKKIRATITNRDNIIDDDWICVFLDTFNERRRAYWFIINPLGVQMDIIRMEEGGNENSDESWDTVFYSDGKIDEQGYTVEMAIPFKSIRFPDKEEKVWGFMLARNIARNGEILTWPGISRSIPGLLSQEEEIRVLGEVEKGKNFELMPIFTSLQNRGDKVDVQPGVNFKWGISSDLTMDLTLNPDFSHIEADAPQIDVNQRFALYYPERRPFFLEGMEIFNFPQIEIFYTRRINDPIGGAKLTGKVGRFTYGFLSAYDTSPTESLWEVSNGGASADDNALFNILRVKTDVLKESYVGFCLTDKEINGSFNRVFGLDGQFKLGNNWFFSFQAVGSQTKFDEEKTELVPAMYADFSYFSKIWSAGVYWMSLHPEFEASSGFINRTDYKTLGTYTSFRFYPEKKYLNQVQLGFNGGMRYEFFGQTMQDQWIRSYLHLRINEFSMVNFSIQNDMERFAGVDFDLASFSIDGETNFIRWLPLGFYFETGHSIYYDPDDPFRGWSNSYMLYMNLKPSKRLQMMLSFRKQTFWEEKAGDEVFDFNVLHTRTTYQFSKTLSLRAIVDYNHFYDEIYGSFLVSWILRPGTVFFFGVDNNLLKNEFGKFDQTHYSVFVKFSYWWRM